MKDKKSSRQLRGGTYTIVVCIVLIAVVFAVNMLVGQLPNNVIEYDTTNRGLFTLSEQTKDVVKSVDQDVNIYLVCQSGNEDNLISKMLERYDDLSDKVTVTKIDPQMNPTFVEKYTTDSLTDNSIIVESSKRFTIIDNSDIYTYIYDDYYDQSIDAFSGEGEVTSAIDFVLKDEASLPIVYMLTGHNEPLLSDKIRSSIERENLNLKDLNLASTGKIPSDAACIMIHSIDTDLSDAETKAVLDYLNNGGKLMLTTDIVKGAETPNLNSILDNYGVETVKGIVVEGDSSKMVSNYNHYVFPELKSHEITDPLIKAKSKVVMPISQGIKIKDSIRGTLSITPLLVTSDSSYSKVAGSDMKTFEKEDGDIAGPFNLGVAISEKYGSEETRIVYFSTSNFLVDDVDKAVSGGNKDLFLNALGWITQQESNISIRAKEVNIDYLSMSGAQTSLISIIAMVVLPLIVIAIGIIVVVRMRKKS